jgi:hypothetical protein
VSFHVDPERRTIDIGGSTMGSPERGTGTSRPGPIVSLWDAEQYHGAYELVAPPHHWSDWYAPYIVARQDGSSLEAATTYIAQVKAGRADRRAEPATEQRAPRPRPIAADTTGALSPFAITPGSRAPRQGLYRAAARRPG